MVRRGVVQERPSLHDGPAPDPELTRRAYESAALLYERLEMLGMHRALPMARELREMLWSRMVSEGDRRG